MPTTFITTSIPYVNGAPHLGHALEFVQADVFARFHRLIGDDTRLLTGTDDNSLNNALAAEREGLPVAQLVARNTEVFRDLLVALDIANDDFISTSTDRRHLEGAARFWNACAARGDIYARRYRGLYCVGCEQFSTPDQLTPDGRCPEHLTLPEAVEEDNYFFRLSRYQDELAALIDSGRLRVVPDVRRNEVRAFIERGLDDISISRSRARAWGWGIPVPGDPGQVMYVWFDALTNYVTALDYATDGPLFDRFWMHADQRLHVIGKGITRFHAVYWPAMLLSAGVRLPSTIFVHGYLTVGGDKLSKSRGIVVDPLALVTDLGTDAVRYWLLRAVPPTADADYTRARIEQAYTTELANDLGNLVQRTLSLLGRFTERLVPSRSEGPDLAPDLASRVCRSLGAELDPRAGLNAIWEVVTRLNQYAEQSAPWREPDPRARAAALYTLAEGVRLVSEALRPFLPRTATQMAEQLGVTPEREWLAGLCWGRLAPGTMTQPPVPLFPRRSDH